MPENQASLGLSGLVRLGPLFACYPLEVGTKIIEYSFQVNAL